MRTTPHTRAGRTLTKLAVWRLFFDLAQDPHEGAEACTRAVENAR